MASIALQDEGGDVWKGWKRIGVTPPSRGWYWKSTRGGNLNHYKHESNGKYLVSTWGELNLSELSMGMSNDYLEAIKFQSTYIRVGSKIFGQRN